MDNLARSLRLARCPWGHFPSEGGRESDCMRRAVLNRASRSREIGEVHRVPPCDFTPQWGIVSITFWHNAASKYSN